jgi:hypothetical protein
MNKNLSTSCFLISYCSQVARDLEGQVALPRGFFADEKDKCWQETESRHTIETHNSSIYTIWSSLVHV